MTKLRKGKLTISRVSGSSEYACITINDELSGLHIEARLSIAEFGQAITGLSYRPCEIELPDHPERLGITKERIEVNVPFEGHDKEKARAVVMAHCPDGYEPNLSLSSQNSIRGGFVNTSAVRWVEVKDDQ